MTVMAVKLEIVKPTGKITDVLDSAMIISRNIRCPVAFNYENASILINAETFIEMDFLSSFRAGKSGIGNGWLLNFTK